ncbi:MAG: DUF308 domain-containing protein [Methanoregula sp.]|jgi:uncharacterized membrane protein HdeD (DUF308 family)
MKTSTIAFSETPVRWWQIALIGVIVFLSGVDAFFWTPTFIDILVTLFGILALAVGLIMIAFSYSFKEDIIYKFPIFLAGITSLIVAVLAILIPGLITPTFIIIMAFIAIINSILLILVGCSLSDQWKTRLVIVLLGMITLFLSILMALFPTLTDVMLVKIWGMYSWVIGTLCIVAGVSMRSNEFNIAKTQPLPNDS